MDLEFKTTNSSDKYFTMIVSSSFGIYDFLNRTTVRIPSDENIEIGDVVTYDYSKNIVLRITKTGGAVLGNCNYYLGSTSEMIRYLSEKKEKVWN